MFSMTETGSFCSEISSHSLSASGAIAFITHTLGILHDKRNPLTLKQNTFSILNFRNGLLNRVLFQRFPICVHLSKDRKGLFGRLSDSDLLLTKIDRSLPKTVLPSILLLLYSGPWIISIRFAQIDCAHLHLERILYAVFPRLPSSGFPLITERVSSDRLYADG